MAKISVIQKNLKKRALSTKFYDVRKKLKLVIKDKSLPFEARFAAQMELSAMPRSSSLTRVRNRCRITGRGRGYMGFFDMSRICMRELAGIGALPGVKKSSW